MKKQVVKFYPKSHKYKLGRRTLTSVTQYLGQFFSPFDANAIAKFMAMLSKKRGEKGKGIKYWKSEWKEAAAHGTRVHNAIEHILDPARPRQELQDKDSAKVDSALNYLQDQAPHPFKPEMVIWDEELGLAGTIDAFYSKKGVVHLVDWKTNKEIKTKGYRNAMCAPPIENLPDCSFTKYWFQLNLYAYMLERKGYTIGTMKLVHLKEDSYGVFDITYQPEAIETLLKYTGALKQPDEEKEDDKKTNQ